MHWFIIPQDEQNNVIPYEIAGPFKLKERAYELAHQNWQSFLIVSKERLFNIILDNKM